jgi:ketosteroid isomerase-like protein
MSNVRPHEAGLSPTTTETAEGVHLSAEAQEMITTIERVFAAIGDDDQIRLKEILCEDFHAFENGVPMAGHELLEIMSRYHAEGRRYQWSVNSAKVETHGNLGVVVYVNRGSITTPGAEAIPMSWLETVVLRRQESRWRLAFLHSTRVP